MATLSQQQQVPPSSPGGMLKGLASTSSLASISSAAPAPAPASASATASATATASASSPLAAAESALVLGAWHRPAAPPSALGSASESAVFLLQSPAGTLLLPWKRTMLKHLVERNGAQCDSFASLIDHHIKQMDVLDEHQAKMTSATRELASLQQENRELKHQLAMSKDHSEMSSALAVRDKVSALEEKLQRTQEELTESYKLKGQNAQMLLDLSQQIKVKDEELRQRQTEHKELLARIATSEKACEDVTARFNESMVAIQILQDELQALQLELLKVEERNKILEVENTSLVERWLRKMNEEALKMNEANMFYESVVDMKKREALMDAAQDKLSLIRQAD
ncbi:tipD [Capsaspora owczarzaki ATCC 30864]|uniref:TipD n=1 Tax=Capsaspora owczarzaki (strain ATCC 30864) TaxID=595528 RepID=A0A0D2X1H2_CAPO3|nr:tipD [Capsaspora owczarzaki ATCC 30864]KJE90804.1 tipD [Capsaspora owczarzaki ATCC 30864]|eukprot:XP_004348800.1 tipD [Capsaspora owczarzaki ATCC 30864]